MLSSDQQRLCVFSLVLTVSTTALAQTSLCPNPVPVGTFCVPANTTFNVPKGWIGASKMIFEDGSHVRFDPSVQPDWSLQIDTIVAGTGVVFDLSGADSQAPKPPQPPQAAAGNQMDNGHAGDSGRQGGRGQDSAKLELDVQTLIVGGLVLLRHGGRGGPGGDGGIGGNGGGGNCGHGGGDGGVGGRGGMGGVGGDAKRVKISYRSLSQPPNPPIFAGVLSLAPGITDDVEVGHGGVPGNSEHGGPGGNGVWCWTPSWPPAQYHTSNGHWHDRDVPPNMGPGPDGNDEGAVLANHQ
jgi:hypothetical protein